MDVRFSPPKIGETGLIIALSLFVAGQLLICSGFAAHQETPVSELSQRYRESTLIGPIRQATSLGYRA